MALFNKNGGFMKNNPIGIFDSGIGGLTVLEKIYELLPNEKYIYLADYENCPYGTKKEEEIKRIVTKNAKFLEIMGAKCIVIACNTASLFASDIRKSVKIPVISVIEPACKKACEVSKNGRIGVIATQMTIKKESYQKRILCDSKVPFGVPCSEFVDYIENDFDNHELGKKIVKEKLNDLSKENIDTLIYGCTHFSLLEDKIKEILGDINYIDCGSPTSILLKELLEKEDLLSENKNGSIEIYTTGEKKELEKKINLFKISYEKIEEVKI